MGKSSPFVTYFQTHALHSQGKLEENYLLILNCFKRERGNCHKSLICCFSGLHVCTETHTHGGKKSACCLASVTYHIN